MMNGGRGRQTLMIKSDSIRSMADSDALVAFLVNSSQLYVLILFASVKLL